MTMTPSEIQAALDRLAEITSAADAIRLQAQTLKDALITDEIRHQLAEIDLEFAPMIEAVTAQGAELEAQIRAAVVENGATVKGAFMQAVYAKGRVSWDTKKLDGLMIALPQLASARTEGQPSVSLRRV